MGSAMNPYRIVRERLGRQRVIEPFHRRCEAPAAGSALVYFDAPDDIAA